jgi:hypothetical protein
MAPQFPMNHKAACGEAATEEAELVQEMQQYFARASLKPALVLPRVSKRFTIGSFGGRGNKARLSISFPAE